MLREVGCRQSAQAVPVSSRRTVLTMVEAGKTERIQKIIDTFGIDEAARDRAFFKKILDEEGPVLIEVVKSLNIEPQ